MRTCRLCKQLENSCLSADMNSSLSNGLVTLRAHAIYKVAIEVVVNSSSVSS
jgi:hypothetical protein